MFGRWLLRCKNFRSFKKISARNFVSEKNVGDNFVRIFIKKLYLSLNPATMAELWWMTALSLEVFKLLARKIYFNSTLVTLMIFFNLSCFQVRWHRTNFRTAGSQKGRRLESIFLPADRGIEPGTAGWETRTLPLCYAVPPGNTDDKFEWPR